MRGLAIIVALLVLVPAAHARDRAPGVPGKKADWAEADKQGFGTSATTRQPRLVHAARART